jgi:crotonobetainyl-CoA:carnitine CoA-transferase CaiB-like acyl-CoA transferase
MTDVASTSCAQTCGRVAMAFDGLRVVDLSATLGGAYAARLLGDFGADVLLVEPSGGHELRKEPPFVGDEAGPERSLIHGMANWNKRSVVETDAGAIAMLVGDADVLVTTAAKPWPAAVAAAVAALPPSGIHLSITPHGLEGPLAQTPGCSLTACARNGWAVINGVADQPPLQLPVRQVSYIAGIAGYLAAAAAIYRGTGETIDVSELEATAMTNAPWAFSNGIFPVISHETGEDVTGGKATARWEGNCQGGGYRTLTNGGPDGTPGPMLWPCADGQINFGMGDWVLWDEAMSFLGCDEMVDSEYTPTWGRYNLDLRPVVKALGEASIKKDKWEIFHALAEHRCITGVVQNAKELLEFPQLEAREFYVESTVGGAADGASFLAPGPITAMSDSPWQLRTPAPTLGQHQGEGWRAASVPREPTAEGATGGYPLAGVRVLTFTQAWAGPFATTMMALLGADVVQIESRNRPDVRKPILFPQFLVKRLSSVKTRSG